MKILKEGDATKRPRPIKFTCDNCGCVFEAMEEECDEVLPYSDGYVYACVCPNCKKASTVKL